MREGPARVLIFVIFSYERKIGNIEQTNKFDRFRFMAREFVVFLSEKTNCTRAARVKITSAYGKTVDIVVGDENLATGFFFFRSGEKIIEKTGQKLLVFVWFQRSRR